jgi:primosomal protein N' (replication factor Y)
MAEYADVVLDITNEQVDRSFTYRIPEELRETLSVGTPVKVPFAGGKRLRTAYVVGLSDEAPPESSGYQIREIAGVAEGSFRAESTLVSLAVWMHRHYGCMLNQAMKTVLPVRKMVRRNRRTAEPAGSQESTRQEGAGIVLTEEQRRAVEQFRESFLAGERASFLLFGVTGSGKTEVYAEMIRTVLSEGRQVILLVPEISLTYQTAERIRLLFGERVARIHSRLSAGERYREFQKAADGRADIMIGPRSALFAPFERLGLIIIDEEHDGAYKNDTVPRYEAADVAAERARLSGASLVLGSATPSAGAWAKAEKGVYRLMTLSRRAVPGAAMASVHVVDLREELRAGNRSVFSRKLAALLEDRLSRGEQSILFMNRRAYASFVSCRACGGAIRCPHCDVTLKLHADGKLRCHYCGYTVPLPKACPDCGSTLLGTFGIGTQKLEQLTKQLFPEARVLRLDSDASSGKGAGEAILSAFRREEADILIGTQMVVKGHDFPKVTLVGIMAADQELYASDYGSAERTFQLLVQAAGRAGRADRPGEVVIQTYRPEHYAVQCAASQDYRRFMGAELDYRAAAGYPPVMHLMSVQLASKDEALLTRAAQVYGLLLSEEADRAGALCIGPADASVYKVQDYFRKFIYVKHSSYDILLGIKNEAEPKLKGAFPQGLSLLYDFS